MRGPDIHQQELFSHRTLEERVPVDRPLRLVRVLVDGILKSMDADFGKLDSAIGCPSIPPERLLRTSLLQIFYTVRSARQLMEQLDFSLLFRWFVGLGMDDPVWDHSTFTQNRNRLLTEELTRDFFSRVVAVAQGDGLTSDEHFSVDGTLVEAWASHKSFKPKEGGSGRDPEVDFKGEKRSNEAHALATGTAEREGALKMARRNIHAEGATLGADQADGAQEFVADLQTAGVAPRLAQNITTQRGSAVPAEVAANPGYAASRKVRQRIEQVFGWGKTVGPMRKTKLRGRAKVAAQTLLGFAAYNRVRMRKLLCLSPLPAAA